MLSLIFDIDDTLYERQTPFLRAFEKTFGDEWDLDRCLLFKQFIKRGNEVFEDSMNGTISMEEMWIYRIRRALEDFQIKISPREALEFQTAYDWHQHHIELSAKMTEIFDLCKEKGMTLGVITNGTSEHQRMKYRALQLERWIPEENFLVTGDIGINKPDLAVFEEAERRMGLNLKDSWYIGDSYEHDIASAKAAGWNAIWLDREKKAESLKNCVADYVVHSEEELKRCVQTL